MVAIIQPLGEVKQSTVLLKDRLWTLASLQRACLKPEIASWTLTSLFTLYWWCKFSNYNKISDICINMC